MVLFWWGTISILELQLQRPWTSQIYQAHQTIHNGLQSGIQRYTSSLEDGLALPRYPTCRVLHLS